MPPGTEATPKLLAKPPDGAAAWDVVNAEPPPAPPNKFDTFLKSENDGMDDCGG